MYEMTIIKWGTMIIVVMQPWEWRMAKTRRTKGLCVSSIFEFLMRIFHGGLSQGSYLSNHHHNKIMVYNHLINIK